MAEFPEPQQAVPAQHLPAQVTKPDPQVLTQAPALHTSVDGHTVPQTPQFFGSVWRFVQTRLEPVPQVLGLAAGHLQAPPEQV